MARHVHIAAGGVNEVVAADRQRISVAHGHDDFKLRTSDLDPCGKRQRPAMNGVHGVKVHVAGDARRTPDPGHHHNLVLGQAQVFNGPHQPAQHLAVPASRHQRCGKNLSSENP